MLDRLMFGLMYRVGFTPWDGHPLPKRLTELVEGSEALPKGKALEIGCGTADMSIYLARNGFQVTGIDYVQRAIDKATKKVKAASVDVRLLRADVTKLSTYGLGSDFSLIVDGGCLHGVPATVRTAYAREVTAVAAPGARLFIMAFDVRKRRGPTGVSREEIDRLFEKDWTVLRSAQDESISIQYDDHIHVHELERKIAKRD